MRKKVGVPHHEAHSIAVITEGETVFLSAIVGGYMNVATGGDGEDIHEANLVLAIQDLKS